MEANASRLARSHARADTRAPTLAPPLGRANWYTPTSPARSRNPSQVATNTPLCSWTISLDTSGFTLCARNLRHLPTREPSSAASTPS
eukprot:174968-Prymnesium_polylepis.1